jgi:hypothetical protein
MEKKNIKVRDLKPSKDAKGGGPGLNSPGLNGPGLNGPGLNTGTTNDAKHNRHHRGSGRH